MFNLNSYSAEFNVRQTLIRPAGRVRARFKVRVLADRGVLDAHVVSVRGVGRVRAGEVFQATAAALRLAVVN